MRLESSASWRGWAAIALGIFGLICFVFVADLRAGDPARVAPGLFLLPAALLGRSWWKLRRRMRVADYQARMTPKALSR